MCEIIKNICKQCDRYHSCSELEDELNFDPQVKKTTPNYLKDRPFKYVVLSKERISQ